MNGTPAHEAATATNRAVYSHQLPAMGTEARTCGTVERRLNRGRGPTPAPARRGACQWVRQRGSRNRCGVAGTRRPLLGGLGAGEEGDADDRDEEADDCGPGVRRSTLCECLDRKSV